jgi:hypothetical protein
VTPRIHRNVRAFRPLIPAPSLLLERDVIDIQSTLDSRVRAGANWFYCIGALSLLNTALTLSRTSITFFAGLGVTQISDALATMMRQRAEPEMAWLPGALALLFGSAAAGLFFVVGKMANEQRRGVFVLGMLLYAADGLILLPFGSVAPFVIHLFALYAIFRGYRAATQLSTLRAEGNIPPAGTAISTSTRANGVFAFFAYETRWLSGDRLFLAIPGPGGVDFARVGGQLTAGFVGSRSSDPADCADPVLLARYVSAHAPGDVLSLDKRNFRLEGAAIVSLAICARRRLWTASVQNSGSISFRLTDGSTRTFILLGKQDRAAVGAAMAASGVVLERQTAA